MNRSEPRNRLSEETSPYLLQHAGNPVAWHPWGPEALERARIEDRPILLSVGYAACHWCHVMERESFEDPSTAVLMNERFVCIKVDREERPDIDDVYMRAVQLMTGHGGWPLTVFLTPELEPFYGGTYFPPEPRMGMPSFSQVLDGVAAAWTERRGEVAGVARQLRDQLQTGPASPSGELADPDHLHRAAISLHDRFDPNYGGFGGAPKFPNATSISLLLRAAHRHADEDLRGEATFSLMQMAAGGIHDQLGGGFHRYSVDAQWLVPHFEKMLYDNALLAGAYLEAYQQTGAPEHRETVRSTLEWALREMRTAEGAFAASLDADSEGVEGSYYVWDRAELEGALGAEAELFCEVYGVTRGGNWEGRNILHLPRPLDVVARSRGLEPEDLRAQMARCRQVLLSVRDARVRPGIDDKVLADWNGLLIAALARAGRALGDAHYLEAGAAAAEFILEAMTHRGRLQHVYRAGQARVPGFLDDYAAMLVATLELFVSSGAAGWIEHAIRLADGMLELFADEGGGLVLAGADQEPLVARTLAAHDGATPSGNGLAVVGLARLARLTGELRYEQRAGAIARAFEGQVRRYPAGFATLLLGIDELQVEGREVVVVGTPEAAEVAAALGRLHARYAPGELVLPIDPGAADLARLEALAPVAAGKAAAAGPAGATLFVCRERTCAPPTRDLEAVLAAG